MRVHFVGSSYNNRASCNSLMNKSLFWTTALLLLLLVIASLMLYRYPLDRFIDSAAIGDFISGFGIPGMAGFILVGAVFTACGLPRQMVAFIGGYSYGVIIGVALGTVAAVFGAMLTFYAARWLARPYVIRKFPAQVAAIDQFVHDKLFLKILTLRFLPFGTNLATNLAAGATNVEIKPFILASGLGFIPQMAIFALTGQGVNVGSTTQLAVAGLLFAVSLAIGFYIYHHRTGPQSR